MKTCIREVRRAKGMTLTDVAIACAPPTTAQTIGRLETGTRTVSVGWLNRIAAALGVTAADLVRTPDRVELPVAALLTRAGAEAPAKPMHATPPQPEPGAIALVVEEGVGDYRAGDTIWCETLASDQFGQALNRDILAPRPGGRLAFGRMIQREGNRMLLLPLVTGGRQTALNEPAWIAVARRLVRDL
jgi:transcriptional regulator with XRE-family HTH domain